MKRENIYDRDGCFIEVLSSENSDKMPHKFIHFTDTWRNAQSIFENGFDLKKCGRSAKKYNADEHLWKWDPCGVFCLEYWPTTIKSQPYVIFEAYADRALYIDSTRLFKEGSYCGKRVISEIYGGKVKNNLTKALLKDGFEAIFSNFECIILDVSLINVISIGGSK